MTDTDICRCCDGSGEGEVDGSTCRWCRGSGVEIYRDGPDYDDGPDERDELEDPFYYDGTP